MHIRTLFNINKILCTPLEAIFTLLIFILSKELNATVLQLTCFACCKPTVSLVGFYCNSTVLGQPHRIRKYLIALNVIGCLPALLFPFIVNAWFYIASYAIFMSCLRASFPAWNQLLKDNLGLDAMPTAISRGTSIAYLMTIFIPLLCSFWMDQDSQIWRILFFIVGILQFLNCFVLLLVKNGDTSSVQPRVPIIKGSLELLKRNPDFTQYLALFFLGGVGLVAIQPILPIYFKETLGLSYTQLTLAISLCKGISFLATSPVWARYVKQTSLYFFNGFINFFSCLYIIFLLTSNLNTHWLLLAYVMYGTMQAGCELSWNLSGPFFSRGRESTLFSSLNLALVGFRGILCPFLGQLIFLISGAEMLFVCAGGLCFLSLIYAIILDQKYRTVYAERIESI